MERQHSQFNAVLDDIYSSFMAVKERIAGRHDQEARHPNIILDVARTLDLLPDPAKTIRITGSKGKGTTSRMIAHLLERQTGSKVALFVSPEELNHNDRMRVNGFYPTMDEFCALYDGLRPELDQAKQRLKGDEYLSPLGIFLLLALSYFKTQGAEYFVLECGRGAAFDEVGQVPSAVAVVTSILNEHAAQLGPSLADIASNKLAISKSSLQVLALSSVLDMCRAQGAALPSNLRVVTSERRSATLVPNWVEDDAALAGQACATLLGQTVLMDDGILQCSASFGVQTCQGRPVYFDGSVQVPSLDMKFFKSLIKEGPVTVLLSLPDDKDGAGIRRVFEDHLSQEVHEVILTGTRGYLHYTQAAQRSGPHHRMQYEDRAAFATLIKSVQGPLYCLGTQTYIRLVKSTLAHLS